MLITRPFQLEPMGMVSLVRQGGVYAYKPDRTLDYAFKKQPFPEVYLFAARQLMQGRDFTLINPSGGMILKATTSSSSSVTRRNCGQTQRRKIRA